MSLQVGDRVKVTQSYFDDVPEGATGTVVAVVPENTSRIYVELDEYPDPFAGVFGQDGWAMMDSEVEKVEVAA